MFSYTAWKANANKFIHHFLFFNVFSLSLCFIYVTQLLLKQNPAYKRYWISWCVWVLASIPNKHKLIGGKQICHLHWANEALKPVQLMGILTLLVYQEQLVCSFYIHIKYGKFTHFHLYCPVNRTMEAHSKRDTTESA